MSRSQLPHFLKPPSLLHTCSESRTIALHYYRSFESPSLGGHWRDTRDRTMTKLLPAKYYLNPSADVLGMPDCRSTSDSFRVENLWQKDSLNLSIETLLLYNAIEPLYFLTFHACPKSRQHLVKLFPKLRTISVMLGRKGIEKFKADGGCAELVDVQPGDEEWDAAVKCKEDLKKHFGDLEATMFDVRYVKPVW